MEAGTGAMEDDGEFGQSTLWVLYRHGIRETLQRLEGQAAGADRVRSLSPQSIEAIRASKADEETELWLRRLRDEAYVETKL